jgi:fimbrial chaperone protein
LVRVQWRGTGNPEKELAYRIIAEQLPIKSDPALNTRSIQLVVRYVGSLYVVPAGVRPDVAVETARAVTNPERKRALELVFNNAGKAHTLFDEPVLTLTAGGKSRTLKTDQLRELAGENILAGSKRRFFIPWPQDLPFEQPKVDFKYTPLR